jgi:hypothetical protein
MIKTQDVVVVKKIAALTKRARQLGATRLFLRKKTI